MSFLVWTKFLIGGSVQMNGQIGDPENGFINMDETMFQLSFGRFDENSSRDLQVPIKPSMPNASSVAFNANLINDVVCKLFQKVLPISYHKVYRSLGQC